MFSMGIYAFMCDFVRSMGCFGAFGRSFLEVRGVLAGKLEARVDA